MVSIIASSMLLGQLMLSQPIVVDAEQHYSPITNSIEGTLIACRWFPLCTIPETQSSERNKDKTKTTDDKQPEKLA